MKPDVIVCWPDNCDYPLWRLFIQSNRERFSKVIVAVTATNSGTNYTEFIKSVFDDDTTTVFRAPIPIAGVDWRDMAINEALDSFSQSKWVWFTEQDFILTSARWFNWVNSLAAAFDAFGVKVGHRIHPCSLFVKRNLIDKTARNFSIDPLNQLDHFGLFTKELEALTSIAFIPKYWHHMAGLSHNWRLVAEGKKPNHQPDDFYKYIAASLEAPVELHPDWRKIAEKILPHHYRIE